MLFTPETLEAARDITFRRTRKLRVKDEDAALDFINSVGFCFAFKSHKSELPCLWHASCGERQPLYPHHSHHDPHITFVWVTKDTLPEAKKVYYGKALKNRPTFISLEYFPYFYALKGAPADLEAYLEQYERGVLSRPAKQIMDILVNESPLPTSDIKMASKMRGPEARSRFDKAIAELQAGMHIAKAAETYDPFTFHWSWLPKHLPKQVKKAAKLDPKTARHKIILKYLEIMIAATDRNIAGMFSWPIDQVKADLDDLITRKKVTADVAVEDRRGKWYGAG
jgi:hypothetical protein